MAKKPDRSTYEGWESWLEKKRRRGEVLESVAHVVAYQALLVSLLSQTWRGRLSGYYWSPAGTNLILAVAAATSVLLVMYPDRGVGLIKKATSVLGSFILGRVTAVALVILYVLSLPVGRFVGRKRFVSRHPGGASWAGGGNWRLSTWDKKTVEADATIVQKGTLRRMFWYFIERGNILVLVMVVILLMAVSFSVLAHTPYLAPFVYTIF